MVQKNRFIAGAVVGLGVAAVAAAGVGMQWPAAMAETRPELTRVAAFAPPPGAPMSFADIFEKVSPAVVSINVTSHVDLSKLQGEDGDGDGEGLPFPFAIPRGPRGQTPKTPGAPGGAAPKKGPEMQASGSGFFISADGYIVTNNHVIEGAENIKVVLQDKRVLTAKVIGHDEGTDLAVLKVEGTGFKYVQFETQVKPRVGDWVIAVGNPFNLGGTATAGIISADGRDLPDSSSQFVNYLQIDAPINRGNSGGPTFDVYGRVIGVNTAIYSPSGGSVGIGFDIPADIAERTTHELLAGRKIVRGYLGVTIQNVTDDIAGSLGLHPNQGALVKDVVPGGPADKAGMQSGDVVLSANGHDVSSNSELTRIVAQAKAGEAIHLKVLRDGKTLSIDVTSGIRPSEAQLAQAEGLGGAGKEDGSEAAPAPPKSEVLGMGLTLMTPALRKDFGLEEKVKGAVIISVAEGSDAEQIGLSKGDVIAKAGDHLVLAPADVAQAVADARKAGRPSILCLIWHHTQTGVQSAFVAIKLEPSK
jgi:serine protease Do